MKAPVRVGEDNGKVVAASRERSCGAHPQIDKYALQNKIDPAMQTRFPGICMKGPCNESRARADHNATLMPENWRVALRNPR
jgi:hypothetical protein